MSVGHTLKRVARAPLWDKANVSGSVTRLFHQTAMQRGIYQEQTAGDPASTTVFRTTAVSQPTEEVRMRHKTGFVLLVTSLALSAIVTLASAHDPKTKTASMKHESMQHPAQMHDTPMTGNQDHDFAMMMREHHKKALPMARMEIEKGKDPELRRTAQNILDSQTKEIAEFDAWLAKHKMP